MKRKTLTQPAGKNKFCGPYALAAIAGITTDEAAKVIRVACNKRAVMGLHNWEMARAIRAMGGWMTSVYVGGNPTLKQWFEDQLTGPMREHFLIIEVTGHYVAAKGDLVDCAMQRGKTHYLSARSANKRVKAVWLVRFDGKPKMPPEVAAEDKRKQEARRRTQRARYGAMALAARMRLKLETTMIYGEAQVDIDVADEAWWQEKLGEHGLLADGESALDMIAETCSLTGYGWEDAHDKLQEIGREFGLDRKGVTP